MGGLGVGASQPYHGFARGALHARVRVKGWSAEDETPVKQPHTTPKVPSKAVVIDLFALFLRC